MAALLTARTGLPMDTVAMLMSAGGDLGISQIVDPLRTVRFVLPKEHLAGLGADVV